MAKFLEDPERARELVKALKDQDVRRMLELTEQFMRKSGRWSEKIQGAVEHIKAEIEAIEKEQEGMSDTLKQFTFWMEHKERIDKAFAVLNRITREEGFTENPTPS